nr:LysR family transcriptional regulator [Pseudomonas sp. TH32]
MHIAPSAVSRQISLLEESIGVPLFERRPRGMQPTAAGSALADHARRASLEEQSLLSELRAGITQARKWFGWCQPRGFPVTSCLRY